MRPSPSRSIGSARTAPGRGSIVTGANDGFFQSVVRFSKICTLARLPVAERADEQIEIAVAVEVRGFDIGDPRQPANPEGRVASVAQSAQPDDRALVVIARQELAEIGDEQIGDAVLVEIDGRGARGIRHARDEREPGVAIVGAAEEHHPVSHVAHDELEPTVAVEIGELDVGHDGRGRRLGWRQQMTIEARR